MQPRGRICLVPFEGEWAKQETPLPYKNRTRPYASRNADRELAARQYLQEKRPRLKIFFHALKIFCQALKKYFQALEKNFHALEFFLKIATALRRALQKDWGVME